MKNSVWGKDRQRTKSIVDYVRSELRTFDELPFSAVDSLVLSQLSYLHLEAAFAQQEVGGESFVAAGLYRAELFEQLLGGVRDAKSNYALLCAVCASPRFRGLMLRDYVSRTDSAEEKQFSAVTFCLPDASPAPIWRSVEPTPR